MAALRGGSPNSQESDYPAGFSHPTLKLSPFLGQLPSGWKRRINDCGPCCLEIVARHYEIKVDMPRLRRLTGLRWWGTTLLNLSRAARELGFTATSVEVTFDGLRCVPFPCIVHIRSNHFVVVHYADAREVWLTDPARGCLRMPKELFCAQSKGVALLLWPDGC